jgi:hypothetical protein
MVFLMSESKRVGRTIRLTPEVNERLIVLCDHLGTNPNAYLVAEIGKAISRDELSFRVGLHTAEMLNLLKGLPDIGGEN